VNPRDGPQPDPGPADTSAVGPRRTGGGGSGLFATYVVASLVPLLVLAAVLVHGYQRDADRRALEQGRAQAAVIAEMAVAPALGGISDVQDGVSAPVRSRLQRATDLSVFHGSVVQLRLRGYDGRVVFSDDGSSDRALPTTSEAFRTAVSGEAWVGVVPDPRGEPGEVIQAVQPVVVDANGRSAGIVELLLPYDAIAADLASQLRWTYLRLGLGLGALYVVLALISWSTTRRLRRHAAQRERDALTDGLTGLPNREGFLVGAERLLGQGGTGALALVDLDRFKLVNDSLGHHAGDDLLRVVADRLRAFAGERDVVARLGGDEFALVMPGEGDPDHVLRTLTDLRRLLAEEVELEGFPVGIEASVGVAVYPGDGADLDALLRKADAAMYAGKHGSAGVVLHSQVPARRDAPVLVVQSEMRRALERDELRLYYQPKVDLLTGATTGVEALVRWQHPTRGLLPPGAFLPAVEMSDLIDPLTTWVLGRALADQRLWTAQGLSWSVAVNVSARNLVSADFVEGIAGLLGTAHPAGVVLEVTETALADARAAVEALNVVSAAGAQVSVDDFGTGYTSLQQLRTLPVAELKIAREFVAGTGRPGTADRPIVRAVVDLAHGLGCRVVAEGVETAEVRSWLRGVGCDLAQGYLFSRPLPWFDLAAATGAVPGAAPLLPVLSVADWSRS
jgi:diguanylate cyclase